MNPYNQLHRSKSDTSDSYKRRRDDHYEDLVNTSVQRPFVITRSVSEIVNVKHDLSPPTQKRICNNSVSHGRSAVYESTFFPNESRGSFGLEEVPPVTPALHPCLRVKNYANQDAEADHFSRSWPILPFNPNVSYATPSRPDYNSGPSGSMPLAYNEAEAALCTPASEGYYYPGASYEYDPYMPVERRPYSHFYNPHEHSTHQDSIPSISLTNSFKENQVRPPSESPVSLCSTGSAKQVVTPDRGTALPVTSGAEAAIPEKRFKAFHEEKWNEHLQQMCEFKSEHGHCLVPHTFPENQHLARWVKRQRRQYKLMLEGSKTSTMTQL
jgi:hypothetical protein